ncbi:Ribosomal RNA small subunit methyltransferase H [Trinorchestia longiramus]|nr:Ribosomal RNA small subunit methyltransferase H [Trinorchestia longiramus]
MVAIPVPVSQFLKRGITHQLTNVPHLSRFYCQLRSAVTSFCPSFPSHSRFNSESQIQHSFLTSSFSHAHQLNTCQIRHIKVDRFEPIVEDGQSHSWDGIYGDQIAELVVPKQGGGVVLDLTFGSGKHTEKILLADPHVRVIAIDRDYKCEEDAAKLRKKYPKRLCFLNIKYSDTVEALYNLGVTAGMLSGAVLDAGLSHAQLTSPRRGGFFNSSSEPIDLRMNTMGSEPSAKHILNHIDEDSLYKVIKIYGQNKKAGKIAKAIVQARYDMQDIRTTGDLHQLIKIVEGKEEDFGSPSDDEELDQLNAEEEAAHDSTTLAAAFHACTAPTFRALRMLVNNEANELDCAIKCVHHLLLPDAPFAVVTYSHLEDTIVKRHFAGIDVDASVATIGHPQHRHAKMLGFSSDVHYKPWQPLTKLLPTYEMKQRFPHWKYAKLRTATKIGSIAYDQVLE